MQKHNPVIKNYILSPDYFILNDRENNVIEHNYSNLLIFIIILFYVKLKS